MIWNVLENTQKGFSAFGHFSPHKMHCGDAISSIFGAHGGAMGCPCQAKVSINALNVPQIVHKHHLEPFENDLERFGKHPKGLPTVWALFPTQNALWEKNLITLGGPKNRGYRSSRAKIDANPLNCPQTLEKHQWNRICMHLDHVCPSISEPVFPVPVPVPESPKMAKLPGARFHSRAPSAHRSRRFRPKIGGKHDPQKPQPMTTYRLLTHRRAIFSSKTPILGGRGVPKNFFPPGWRPGGVPGRKWHFWVPLGSLWSQPSF